MMGLKWFRFLAASILFLGMSSYGWSNDWIAAGADNLWDNADNWSQGVAPLNATSHPQFGWDDPDLSLIHI